MKAEIGIFIMDMLVCPPIPQMAIHHKRKNMSVSPNWGLRNGRSYSHPWHLGAAPVGAIAPIGPVAAVGAVGPVGPVGPESGPANLSVSGVAGRREATRCKMLAQTSATSESTIA